MPTSEHQLQVQLARFLEVAAHPDVMWFAIPNGGKRHIRVAVRLKEEGTKRGVPDLCFVKMGGGTAWLEMKVKGGRLSPEQKLFRDEVLRLGHQWGMAKTFDEAIAFLRSVGALKSTVK